MSQETVEFPITGKVIGVDVKLGDVVAEGDTLCTIESMKMENPILAPVGGKIIRMELKVGQTVNAGDVVAIIQY